ncbi:MAG: methylated-DNA--[protein]-cysteine S-methyltransferase [Halanaerobiaceae bacterium]
MKDIYSSYYPSPIGILKISFTAKEVREIKFVKEINEIDEDCCNGIFFKNQKVRDLYNLIYDQLNDYFIGKRKSFNLPCNPEGTDFEKQVWSYIENIPYGEISTYKEVAQAIGHPEAARAVGNAARKNPLIIIIPCHRVVSSTGEISGYIGGVRRKKWLLKHEYKYIYQKDLKKNLERKM